MADVMGMVRFRVMGGAELGAVAAGVGAWLSAQRGFVSRTLVGPDADGVYTDLVRWRSAEDAHAAMAACEDEPSVGAFMAAVDPATVDMRHVPVILGT